MVNAPIGRSPSEQVNVELRDWLLFTVALLLFLLGLLILRPAPSIEEHRLNGITCWTYAGNLSCWPDRYR